MVQVPSTDAIGGGPLRLNIFVIESLAKTTLVDRARVTMDAVVYLKENGAYGVKHEEKVSNKEEVNAAFRLFAEWSAQIPDAEWILLWISMHGKPPKDPNGVGTSAGTAKYSESPATEEVKWFKQLKPIVSQWHKNTIVLMDVCWGASPTFASRATGAKAKLRYVFGPTRSGYRLELDAAAALVIGSFGRYKSLPLFRAKAIVGALNRIFPTDSTVGTRQFYRLWWWDKNKKPRQHPRPPPSARRVG